MSKKTIIIAPNAGFGNRLRSMVAAIYLSEQLNMEIEHLWIKIYGTQKSSFSEEAAYFGGSEYISLNKDFFQF